MFVTVPDAVKAVANEIVTQEELGFPVTRTTKPGVAGAAFDSDIGRLLAVPGFVDFLPAPHREAQHPAMKRD